jgi:hypothetical protein
MTTWYHDDDVCWVADCEICDVPMVVWRRHGAEPSPAERDHMLGALRRVADDRFGDTNWTLDTVMRQIPGHFHAHARDKGWWTRRFGSRVLR